MQSYINCEIFTEYNEEDCENNERNGNKDADDEDTFLVVSKDVADLKVDVAVPAAQTRI